MIISYRSDYLPILIDWRMIELLFPIIRRLHPKILLHKVNSGQAPFNTGSDTCPCATRCTSIYKGLATFHVRCSRNCQWDERRSLGVGVQALASNPLQAAAAGNVNPDSSHVRSQYRTVLATSNAITCLWHCGMRHRVWRAVWEETFTHGSVRGWGLNSLALLDLWPFFGYIKKFHSNMPLSERNLVHSRHCYYSCLSFRR